jgi:hypothetical protein
MANELSSFRKLMTQGKPKDLILPTSKLSVSLGMTVAN